MVFSSPIFIFMFLPVLLALYLLSARRELRNPLLLVASLFFYAWGEPWFVYVMVLSIFLNYLFGLWIDSVRGRGSARWALAVAVAFNLGLLGAFKYANFVMENVNVVLGAFGISPVQVGSVPLPIGISFFTFQAMSYVIDVYRRDALVQKNPLNVALYISLFPQLIAGPIVRYRDIAAQLIHRTITREGFAIGIRRFITGLGKKVLIANVLAGPVDRIFSAPAEQLTAGVAWLGVVCFTLQIYFDFSGYSDMAIGLGRMFGFRFLENFNYPYIARSIREFWKRWHISLSTWFRDYLYFSLGGSRVRAARVYFNLVTVFLLCGLWHGASWTFVAWGLFHGAFLVFERTSPGLWVKSLPAPFAHFYVLVVVTAGWTIFRAETLFQAGHFFLAMAGAAPVSGVGQSLGMYVDRELVIALVAGIVFSTPLVPSLARARERLVSALSEGLAAAVEITLCSVTVLADLMIVLTTASYLAAGTYNPFIYFRF
jgi:alginate O-acetyltransferase complex protein AlgI